MLEFCTRSILEFLAAQGLSEEPDWLAEARQRFWYDQPEWLETIVFLAGLVEDVRPLIDALRAEEDDLFGWKYYMEARFIGAANLDDDSYIMPTVKLVGEWWFTQYDLIGQLGQTRDSPFLYQPMLPTLIESLLQSSRASRLVKEIVVLPLLTALRQENITDLVGALNAVGRGEFLVELSGN